MENEKEKKEKKKATLSEKEVILFKLKQKRDNLDSQIRNLEIRIENQKRCQTLTSKKPRGEEGGSGTESDN